MLFKQIPNETLTPAQYSFHQQYNNKKTTVYKHTTFLLYVSDNLGHLQGGV